MISRRIISAALRCLGHDEGRNWDYLGGLFHAGTAAGVDVQCFVVSDGKMRFFKPDSDDLFLLVDTVKGTREAMFHDRGGPRFRHCLAIIRGSDEKTAVAYAYEEDPDWLDVADRPQTGAQRVPEIFDAIST